MSFFVSRSGFEYGQDSKCLSLANNPAKTSSNKVDCRTASKSIPIKNKGISTRSRGIFFVTVVKEWPPRWSEWHTISKPSLALLLLCPMSEVKHRKHGFGHGLGKGQLISKCPFGVFKSSKKPTFFSRISALASKKRSNQKRCVRGSK